MDWLIDLRRYAIYTVLRPEWLKKAHFSTPVATPIWTQILCCRRRSV